LQIVDLWYGEFLRSLGGPAPIAIAQRHQAGAGHLVPGGDLKLSPETGADDGER
jgi:hypothetical protein